MNHLVPFAPRWLIFLGLAFALSGLDVSAQVTGARSQNHWTPLIEGPPSVEEEWLEYLSSSSAGTIIMDDEQNVYVYGNGGGLFVAKYDPDGNEIWRFKVEDPPGANYSYAGSHMALDSNGDLVVVGREFLQTLDMVVFKLDSDGSLIWFQQLDQASSATRVAIGVNDAIHVIISSYLDRLMTLDAQGNVLWTAEGSGPSYSASTIEVGTDGRIVMTGTYFGSAETYAFAPDGRQLWMTSLPATGRWLALGPNDEVYVAGNVAGVVGPSNDLYLAKLESDGTYAWSHSYNGPWQNQDSVTRVLVDSEGNPIIYGESQGTLVNGQPTGNFASVVLKYAPWGQLIWETRHTSGFGEHPRNAVLGPDDSIYVVAHGASGENDWMTFKLDADGELLWDIPYVTSFGCVCHYPKSLVLDAANDSLYVSGVSPGIVIKYAFDD